jgi:hypothetical protein
MRAAEPERVQLRPEAAPSERDMEIEDAFPLDNSSGPYRVVADVQRHDLHEYTEVRESARYTARPLVHVSEDHRRSHLPLTLPTMA